MKMLTVLGLLLATCIGTQAYAMKCEVSRGQDHSDCDYRVYTHGSKVDLYASDCEYSDDNGGPATYSIIDLTRLADGKYSLNTGGTQIVLTCGK